MGGRTRRPPWGALPPTRGRVCGRTTSSKTQGPGKDAVSGGRPEFASIFHIYVYSMIIVTSSDALMISRTWTDWVTLKGFRSEGEKNYFSIHLLNKLNAYYIQFYFSKIKLCGVFDGTH